MPYPFFHSRTRRGANALGAALVAAVLLTGCGDEISPSTAPPNLETIAPPSVDVEMAGVTAASPRTKGRIVFVRDGNIHIMSSNGSGATQLTTSGVDLSPVLSPDGTRIAFVRMANGMADVYLMSADGSGVTPLTQNTGFNTSPSWSPTGVQIAFTSTRDGDADIYVMNADGTGVTALTVNAVYDGLPAWSPDGTRIAFTTEQVSAGNREIFVMNADGTNAIRLTTSFLWDQEPAWSPDGNRIAFTCDRVVSQSPFQSSNEICVMNADGSGVVAITNAPSAFDSQPTWSPDGARIAFASDRDGDYDLYVVKVDGGRVSTLTRNTLVDTYPSWGK